MSLHRKRHSISSITASSTRVVAGLALGAGVLAAGLHMVPAHASSESLSAAGFRHIEDEGNRPNGFDRLQVNKVLAKERLVAAQRADRAKRAKLEAERPKWVRPVNSGVSSPFGIRWGRMHSGIDFVAGIGTPVHAAGDGVVTYPHDAAGYGILLNVAHPDGATTWYCHLSKTLVTPGQKVKAGDIIGYSGATGNVTGPHLHFEVRFGGRAVDPLPWLRGHGVRI